MSWNRKVRIDFSEWATVELERELNILKNQPVPKLSHYDKRVIKAIQTELTRRT